ncbi:Cytoskeleton protein RodZ [bacterium HR10]|nr:Cytoskeleton protein RodZ [bacterium HR10]
MQTERLTLGQELRRRREAKGIELQDISNATRVAVRFLRAIEEDDFASLPGGLFTRSFIRTYARHVGMDEEEAIARYYEQTGQTREEIPRYPFTTVAAERARSIFWTRVVVILFVAGVLAVGGYGGWHYWQREGKRLWEQRGSQPAPVLENREPARAPVAPSSESVSAPSSVSAETESATVSPTPAPSISSASKPLEIRLEATGNCWISVQVDDEPKPRQEMLRAGDVRTFTPQKQVRLSVGSVPALKVTINGQPAQLPSVGHVARGVIITPENARQFITP